MRRIVASVLAVAVVAALFAASPTVAATRFRFFGSGYGHGIGMSQWGAYGLAKQGWGANRILTHFYRGTQVRGDVVYPKRVRVGLAWGLAKAHLTAKEGRVRLTLGGPGGALVGEIRRGLSRRCDQDRYAVAKDRRAADQSAGHTHERQSQTFAGSRR